MLLKEEIAFLKSEKPAALLRGDPNVCLEAAARMANYVAQDCFSHAIIDAYTTPDYIKQKIMKAQEMAFSVIFYIDSIKNYWNINHYDVFSSLIEGICAANGYRKIFVCISRRAFEEMGYSIPAVYANHFQILDYTF